MEREYIAFLRGVNINGKNRLAMAELKKEFEAEGFRGVKTYLNSGNVRFLCEENDGIAGKIQRMIRLRFALNIPVFVIAREQLADILRHAPVWWGTDDPEIYDNLIFILPPASFVEVSAKLGPKKEGLEWIEYYGGAVFWSFSRKNYQKTNWWPKTASAGIKDALTIRTANTVRKLAEM